MVLFLFNMAHAHRHRGTQRCTGRAKNGSPERVAVESSGWNGRRDGIAANHCPKEGDQTQPHGKPWEDSKEVRGDERNASSGKLAKPAF
jgi:hypothetical protein